MIAWGYVYSNSINLLKRLQIRLLKIVNKNKFFSDKNSIYLDEIFVYESLSYHYNVLQLIYLTSNKTTRNKSIQIPKRLKTISSKNSFIRALMVFNRLPNEFKNITSTYSKKRKLKKWVKENIWKLKITYLFYIEKFNTLLYFVTKLIFIFRILG